jgi:hypothetical protein
MNETRNQDSTPDQLLELLDAQLAAARSKRGSPTSRSRVALLVGGLLFILVGCGAALLILQQMLSDLPHPIPEGTSQEIVKIAPDKNR